MVTSPIARKIAESSDSGQRIRIVVDDREPGESMLAALAACENFVVEVRRLKVGDYLVDDALLVERKTLCDLVAAIKDGRLFRQALRLARGKIPAVLILEGTVRDLQGTGMRWEAIQGALITVSLFIGLPVLRSRKPEETVRTIAYAVQQRRSVVAGNLTRNGRRPKGKPALQSYLLQGLPGVGPRRAERLLQRFGSVEAAMAANVQALADVEGLGLATARKIRWAVEEPPVLYHC